MERVDLNQLLGLAQNHGNSSVLAMALPVFR